MGIQHLLLLLIYLDPLCGVNANKRSKGPARKSGKVKEVNSTAAPGVVRTSTGPGLGPGLGPGPGSFPGAGSRPGSGSFPGAGSGPFPGPGSRPDSGLFPGAGSRPGSGPFPGAGTGPFPGGGSGGPGSRPGSGSFPGGGSGPFPAPGTAQPRRITQLSPPSLSGEHDTCLGYYDVSGQYDKEFACNNTDHRFCCGSCFLRFCCPIRAKRLEQRACTNYNTPDWIKTQPPSPAPTGEVYDPALDRTNTTVYIACGVVALILLLGISAKVAYDKATRPPQEMNVHRALTDILRQQGPVPVSQYEEENMATIEGSPKESSLKNHYTPVHNKTNHGHHGKDNFRSGQDMHNFISSGFVTLGRGHLKAQHSVDDLGGLSWQGDLDVPLSYNNHQHDYTSHLDLTGSHTPKLGHRIERYEKPRMNNILTSQTEPYDLSFSRSFQNLTHLPPSYEMAMKADLSEKEFDDFYSRKKPQSQTQQLLLPEPHLVKLSSGSPPSGSSHRPRRVQRALSQDHVLSPPMPRSPRRPVLQSAMSYAAPPSPYRPRPLQPPPSPHRPRPLQPPPSPHRPRPPPSPSPHRPRAPSQEQLLSADRLRSRDPLLSPEDMLSLRRSDFRNKMSRALSQADMLEPDHHYHKITKTHSNPNPSSGSGLNLSLSLNPNEPDQLNTLTVNSANRRQAFASRRTHTVDHLQYIPAHTHTHQHQHAQQQAHAHTHQHAQHNQHNQQQQYHQYRTASKTEVTV